MGAIRKDTLKTRRELGSMSVRDLARLASVSHFIVQQLEAGGTCTPEVSQQILNALAPPVAITSNSQANPSVITTATTHTFQTGDTVVIAGVVGSNADINGTRVVTRVSATQFSVPVNAGTSGGTGGTVTIDGASVGLARL